ncbi:MAG: hypothetical protein LBQ15_08100 [Clostridium sp.]|jgi:hypothetical protein|nr:hypothetical protein [Clostridium sp.]
MGRHKIQNGHDRMLKLASPIITTYTQHAHLLSILGGYEPAHGWIYSNYINLYSNKYLQESSWADFYFPKPYELRPSDHCEWLTTQKLHRSLIKDHWGEFLEFLKYAIDHGWYLHLMLDYFHIAGSSHFESSHRIHDALLYGYDLNKGLIYACDFLIGTSYGSYSIPIQKINPAFDDGELSWNSDYLNGIVYLYRLDPDRKDGFVIENVFRSMKRYLEASVLEYWDMYNFGNQKRIVFGKDYYGALSAYLRNQPEPEELDLRMFYLLYDHKKMMTRRFDYLTKSGFTDPAILPSLSEIEGQCKTIVNLCLKYKVSRHIKEMNKISDFLKDAEEKEYEVLSKAIG